MDQHQPEDDSIPTGGSRGLRGPTGGAMIHSSEDRTMRSSGYLTDELELAAFLKARGYRLLGAEPYGRLVTFAFDPSACADVDNYFAGAEISARELFEAHRHLRTLIKQIKQHKKEQIGSDNYDRHFSTD
jgi:hypothetical protein